MFNLGRFSNGIALWLGMKVKQPFTLCYLCVL
jgi:hypothetical protein